MKILELEEKGRRALGINGSESDRHGGAEHRYWCRRLAKRLRAQGYVVTEEAPIGGGRTIDLLSERDGKRIALEVETGKSDVRSNVRKCLAADVDKIIVVAVRRSVRNSIRAAIPTHPDVWCVSAPDVARSSDLIASAFGSAEPSARARGAAGSAPPRSHADDGPSRSRRWGRGR